MTEKHECPYDNNIVIKVIGNSIAIIIILCIIATPIFLLVWSVNAWSGKRCRDTWQSFETKYKFSSGCLVNVDGKYIPEDKLKDGAFALTGVKIDDRRA